MGNDDLHNENAALRALLVEEQKMRHRAGTAAARHRVALVSLLRLLEEVSRTDAQWALVLRHATVAFAQEVVRTDDNATDRIKQ